MKKIVFLIQKNADAAHIEQAIDACLVAAIFDQDSQLVLIDAASCLEKIEANKSLTDKYSQLASLNISVIKNHSDPSNIYAALQKADTIFSY